MTLTLHEHPNRPIIIQGFPGVGLVGSIVTEYLVNSPDVKQIGHIFLQDMPPIVVVHQSTLYHPIGLFYDKKHNLVIVHTLIPLQGLEWQFADELLELYKQLDAWELISVEGVGSGEDTTPKVLGFANNPEGTQKRLVDNQVTVLNEGILFGISAAMMLKAKMNDIRMVGLYATSHSQMPDSVAASEVIKTLDKLFNFNIDPKPLLEKAQEFEQKLRTIASKSSKVMEEQENLNYVG